MIFIAGISLAVFIELLLLTKKDKSEADRFLAIWMSLISLHLFLFYFWFTQEVFQYPFLLGVDIGLPLLQSVMLYLYVGSLTDQLPSRRILLGLHFLPASLVYLYLIPFFALSAEEKTYVYQNHGVGYEGFSLVIRTATALSGIVYIGWSLLLLRRHTRRIREEFSYQSKIDLLWLRILIWGMGVIWILIYVSNDTVLFGAVVVLVFLIGFFGIKQVRIFGTHAPPPIEKEKYSKSGLTEEKADKLYESLIQLMTQEGLFRKNDLSVNDLADRLDVHPNYLSQIINAREGVNFYDFVNRYRVEEFKRTASDPRNRHLTLLALAFDCGFNSKSSFNRYFKKATGQTPSQFYSAPQKQ